MFDLKSEEILTCFLLIVVGYYIAKMFSRTCNGFSIDGQSNSCDKFDPVKAPIGRFVQVNSNNPDYPRGYNGVITSLPDPVSGKIRVAALTGGWYHCEDLKEYKCTQSMLNPFKYFT